MNLAFEQDPHFDAVEEADDEEGGDDDHHDHDDHDDDDDDHGDVAKRCGRTASSSSSSSCCQGMWAPAQASDSGGEQLGAAVSWHPKALQGRRRPTPPSDAFDRDSCTS